MEVVDTTDLKSVAPKACRFESGSRYQFVFFCFRGVMKLRTKSSAKKRFRLTASGLVKTGQTGKRHNMRKRGNKMLRNARGMIIMHPSDAKKVRDHFFHI